MSFFESKGWKNFTAKAYGLGAAAVITGALFKIMHFPYSGLILTIGMGVEAMIFVISAFEPLPKEYKWENVYPELAEGYTGGPSGMVSPERQMPVQQQIGMPSVSNLNLDIDKSTTDELKTGIKRFTESIGQMSNLSGIIDASAELTGNISKASVSMSAISESTSKLSEAYQKNVLTIQSFNEQSKLGLEQMASGYDFYRGQLETLGRTMGAVNSSYELYLQEAKKVQSDYATLHTEVGSLIGNVHASIEETQKFGAQMSSLNNNVSQLNSVYGSMLTAVNTVLNK